MKRKSNPKLGPDMSAELAMASDDARIRSVVHMHKEDSRNSIAVESILVDLGDIANQPGVAYSVKNRDSFIADLSPTEVRQMSTRSWCQMIDEATPARVPEPIIRSRFRE